MITHIQAKLMLPQNVPTCAGQSLFLQFTVPWICIKKEYSGISNDVSYEVTYYSAGTLDRQVFVWKLI